MKKVLFRIASQVLQTYLFIGLVAAQAQTNENRGLNIQFQNDAYTFSSEERHLITATIGSAETEIRKQLPALPESIQVQVSAIDRDLTSVSGVAGRSDTHEPEGKVLIWISHTYPGGIEAAVTAGLRTAVYHEFHHLARGWTLEGNKYGPGIPNALVNEGLAVVFAEENTGIIQEGNSFPEQASDWVDEILQLPLDADYQQWVSGIHPDGRSFIGYRAGNFLVRQALDRSGKNIVELSQLLPEEIFSLAGFQGPDERLVANYYAQNLKIFQTHSTKADIDALFENFTEDFTYTHMGYGGVYSREELYQGYLRNQQNGNYNGRVADFQITEKMSGRSAMVVKRRYITLEAGMRVEGDAQMTLFEFRRGKIARIVEYW